LKRQVYIAFILYFLSLSSHAAGFEITGGTTTGKLEIDRVELSFQNNLPEITVNQYEKIKATAIIRFSGNGLFSAEWQVDGITVEPVNILISYGSTLTLPLSDSTVLPSYKPGRHQLRLNILQPISSFELPSINYFVQLGSKQKASDVVESIEKTTAVEPSENIKRALLYFRKIGETLFRVYPLQLSQDGVFKEQIPPPSVLSAPGIEYYLQYFFEDGSTQTDPVSYPTFNPYRQMVVTQLGQDFKLKESIEGDFVAGQFVDIDVNNQADTQDFKIFLDNMDISQTVTTHASHWRYKLAENISPGSHTLTIKTDSGRTLRQWPIMISEAKKTKTGVITTRGSASFNYGSNAANSGGSSDSLSANLQLQGDAEKNKLKMHLADFNLQYVKDAPEEFTLSSGSLFTAEYDNRHFIDYGDVSVSETPLVVSGFARRGLHYRYLSDNAETHFFNVKTNTVVGNNSGVGFDMDKNTIGMGYLNNLFFGDNEYSIHLAAISGGQQSSNGAGTAGTLNAAQGDTIGATIDTSLGYTSIHVEFGFTSFDNNSLDDQSAKSDSAFQIDVSSQIFGTSWQMGLLRYGADYATIANPNMGGDRQSFSLSISDQLEALSWSLSSSLAEDNIDRESTRPIISNQQMGSSIGYTLPDWPSFQLGFNVSTQTSRDEADVSQQLDNSHNNISIGVSHTISNWSVGLSTAMGMLEDNLLNTESETHNINLTTSWSDDGFSVAPNLSHNETVTQGVINTSQLFSLNASIPLWAENISLSTHTSYQLNDASDGSVDNYSVNSSMRVSWRLSDVNWIKVPDWANAQFGLSGQYSKTTDKISSTEPESDYVVLLTFNLGAPYDFELNYPF